MFSLYDTLFNKIAFTVFLFIMRMALFFHCQTHPPVYVLTGIHILIIQILNTVVFFVVTSVICISFSSNLQKAEQHLMLYNIELQQQAGTDPLTTLYNRRRMEEVLKNHIRSNPRPPSALSSLITACIFLISSISVPSGALYSSSKNELLQSKQ